MGTSIIAAQAVPNLRCSRIFWIREQAPARNQNLCCGFRQGASHPLKVSPERRPVKAGVEVPRQARDHELVEWPEGWVIHEREVSS